MSKWINIKDRAPDVSTVDAVGCRRNGDMERYIDVDYENGSFMYWSHRHDRVVDITDRVAFWSYIEMPQEDG